MTTVAHSWFMTQRQLRALSRQPWYIAINLVQPVIWLLIFGQLFKRIIEIPGFTATSYITFLTPAVVVMTALFAGGWAGMGFIEDLDRGVMNRFLVSPTRRGAILAGRMGFQAVLTTVQSLLIVLLGLAVGARFAGGIAGVAVLVVSGVLISASFAALSTALALMLRRAESVIAAVQFVAMPLVFLSSGFMAANLAPTWIQAAAAYNPVNWAVVASRTALAENVDWGLVAGRGAYLLVFTVVCGMAAVRAFRSYQRSV